MYGSKTLKVDPPVFPLGEPVTHNPEPALGLCVVALDYDVLKMPEPPGEVI